MGSSDVGWMGKVVLSISALRNCELCEKREEAPSLNREQPGLHTHSSSHPSRPIAETVFDREVKG